MTLGDCRGIRRMVLKTINLNGLSGKWMVDRKIELFCQLEIGENVEWSEFNHNK
jgi:hypothetical protein